MPPRSDNGPKELKLSWGLHHMMKALSFLINDCSLIHNHVHMAAVFVGCAGEWKLGGLDYMYSPRAMAGGHPSARRSPSLSSMTLQSCLISVAKPSERNGQLTCGTWAASSGKSLMGPYLGPPHWKISKSLVPHYCDLVGASTMHSNLAHFLQNCQAPGRFMNNHFVNTNLFLEEIQIKELAEKQKFFQELIQSLDWFREISVA